MTLAMRMTLDGLLRALRWRAFEIAERANEKTASADKAGPRGSATAGAKPDDNRENRK